MPVSLSTAEVEADIHEMRTALLRKDQQNELTQSQLQAATEQHERAQKKARLPRHPHSSNCTFVFR